MPSCVNHSGNVPILGIAIAKIYPTTFANLAMDGIKSLRHIIEMATNLRSKWRQNCDTSKWSVDPWEVAKFFMSALGDNKGHVKNAESTDFIILNVFQSVVLDSFKSD